MKKIIYSFGICLCVSQVSAQVVNNGSLYISDGAVVSFNTDVQNSGELTNKGNVYFRNNLTNNGNLQSSGVAVFDGYEKQQLNGAGVTLDHVQLQNDLRLNAPLTVGKELDFRRGVIQTNEQTALVFAENATHSGASDFSHVAGNVQKLNASSFEFPVGDGYNYRGFEVKEANQSTLKAEYFAQSPTELTTNMAQGVEAMNQNEYWLLTSAQKDAKLKVNLAPTVYDYNQIAYLKRGRWEVSEDNRLSDAAGLRDGVIFTSGKGRLIQKEIGVWPNPTQGEFNLKLTGMNPDNQVKFMVVNQDGRVIMEVEGKVRELRKVYQLPQSLPTTELTLRLVDAEDVFTQKLVLDR